MTLARTITGPFAGALPWEAQGPQSVTDNPITIFGAANVALMLDYTLGITLGTPPAVAAWADQSGNANNASQGTAGNRPDLVATGLDFNGTTDNLSIADAANLDNTTRLIVGVSFIPDVVTGNRCPITKSTTVTGSWALQSSLAAMRMHFGAVGTAFSEGGTMTAGVLQRMIHEYDGGGATNALKLQQYLNSATATVLAFTGTIPTSIVNGANAVKVGSWENDLQHFDGVIKRVAVINGVISTAAQRARLDAWLARP